MRTQKELKGFTLVELLVVIAIIALLNSFVLVAIVRYRDRARDSRIEAVLSQVRPMAAMIYTDDNSYENLCDDTDTLRDGLDNEITRSLKIIEDEAEKTSGSKPTCYAFENTYCVQSSLVSSGHYCVDSTGYAGSEQTICLPANIKCAP